MDGDVLRLDLCVEGSRIQEQIDGEHPLEVWSSKILKLEVNDVLYLRLFFNLAVCLFLYLIHDLGKSAVIHHEFASSFSPL